MVIQTIHENKTIITDIGPVCLACTFSCGQAFRWQRERNGWLGIADGRLLRIRQLPSGIELHCPANDMPFWAQYFDLDYDYETARRMLQEDTDLAPAITAMPGLRFLNQPFFECLISFIISANNNIPRIKGIIEKLCKRYGEAVADACFSFPSPAALARASQADIRTCGAGYRADYIIEAARVITESFDHESLNCLPLDEAQRALMQIKGVGAKVANCVLLFSLGRKDAFPVDTWVKKAMAELYGRPLKEHAIRQLAKERFGEHAGLAQQYLFHSLRLKAVK